MINKKERFLLLALGLLLLLSVIILAGLKQANVRFLPSFKNASEIELMLEVNRPIIASIMKEDTPRVESISEDELIFGDIAAPVKLLVYEDYADINSAVLNQQLIKAETVYWEQIAIAIRPYSVTFSDISVKSALAMNCARKLGYETKFRDKLYLEVLGDNLSEESIYGIVKELGIAEFDKCFKNQNNREALSQSLQFTAQSVFGAPTIFANGEIIIGSRSFEDEGNMEGLNTIIKRKSVEK